MRAKKRLTITLPPDLLAEIDRLIDKKTVRNRSHAIELLLRDSLKPTVSTAVLLAGGPSKQEHLPARSAANHPSLKSTGAAIGWGIDDPREVEAWAPGIRLLEEYHFSDDPDLARLNIGYRVAYKLAGAFKIVQRAHRIVYYQL